MRARYRFQSRPIIWFLKTFNPQKEKLSARLTLRISEQLHRQLHKEAARRRRSLNWLANDYLARGVKGKSCKT